MKFFSTVFTLAMAAVAYAQTNPNPFNVPLDGQGLKTSAGSVLNLTWTPTTPGTVTLTLRYGNSAFLNESGVIASSLPNNGQYLWNVPSDIVRGSSYAVEIVSDSDPKLVNYTPQFIIDSTVLTASSGASLIASATASNSASTSGSATNSASTTGSASTSASVSGSTSATGSTTTSSASRSSASSAGIQTVSTTGGAPRATVMAGMLGAVALGALAL